jgi:hypothetical protein
MDLQDYGSSGKARVLNYAVQGLKALNLFAIKSVRVQYLKMDDLKRVKLPADYVYYTKIGINTGDGKVWTLTLNNDLSHKKYKYPTALCEDEVENETSNPDIEYGYLFQHHYRGGQYVGELYGQAGGVNVSSYRVDESAREIQFSADVPSGEIVLEYKSNGISNDGSTVIPQQAVMALKSFVHWQLVEYDKTAPMADKDRKRRLYGTEYANLKLIETLFTKDEFLDRVYKDSTLTMNRG